MKIWSKYVRTAIGGQLQRCRSEHRRETTPPPDTDFIEEMEAILDPCRDLEIGHNDFVYGSYVE